MTTFEVDVRSHQGHLHVSLRGQLDIATAERVEDALRGVEDRHSVLVLDLSRVSSIDSGGLRMLVAADKRSRATGRRLIVVRGPEAVHQVLMITRLDERLEIVDDAGQLEGI